MSADETSKTDPFTPRKAAAPEPATPVRGAAADEPGILPAQQLDGLIERGRIYAERPMEAGQVQPASIDLRLGSFAYRVRASFLPGARRTVESRLDDFATHGFYLDDGAVLEKGCVYLVEVQERLKLPLDVSGVTNPKSSIGRLDVFTRVIADGATEFDRVPAGYSGRLYAEISPLTFSVIVRTGSRLGQLRLVRGSAATSGDSLRQLETRLRMETGEAAFRRGALTVSVDLAGDGDGSVIGYRARRYAPLVDVDVRGEYDALDYWEPIRRRGAPGLILDPNDFYILRSRESISVPPDFAAEMVAYDTLVGEFRVHYAGFFDPGFGHAANGGAGTKAVLEVRSHEVPFHVGDGQVVGRLVYEPMAERPARLYGSDIGSHYQRQSLRLSRHFRMPGEGPDAAPQANTSR